MQQLAAEGRTVFVSSHLMSEMAVTADHLIVIGRGRLIADSSTQEFIQRSSDRSVLVRTPDQARLRELITAAGGVIQPERTRGRRRRGRRYRRGGQHDRHRTSGPADRGTGGLRVGRAVRVDPQAGFAGGGIHGADRDSVQYGQPSARGSDARPPDEHRQPDERQPDEHRQPDERSVR